MEAKHKNEIDRTEQLKTALCNSMVGHRAHLSPERIFEGLDYSTSGQQIPNSPHTIWQLLRHLNYWQDRFIARLEGLTALPARTSEEGWLSDPAPADEMEWQQEVEKFLGGISYIQQVCVKDSKCLGLQKGDYKNGIDVVQAMASHISYHLGEVVLLRRMLGAWPPPSGGLTW